MSKRSYGFESETGQVKQTPPTWERRAGAHESARPASGRADGSTKTVPSHTEIAKRAEAIWQAKGRPRGQDEQNWLEAEAQLKRERGSV